MPRRRPPPEPDVRFRLYPEGRWLYFHVNIWPDRESMLDHFGRWSAEYRKANEDAAANCQGEDVYSCRPGWPMKKTGRCGEINLYRGRITTEIAAHEITHATFRWAWRIKLDPKDMDGHEPHVTAEEERFCYALGRMVQQFADRAVRYKLWAGVTWERSKA